MATYDKYTVTQYSINSILGYIEAGEIAIPEIQRPFVWKGKQVRDLIDSLYNGYPTGYLIIWQNPNVRLKNGKEAACNPIRIEKEQITGFSLGADIKPGDTVELIKYVAIASSLCYDREDLVDESTRMARRARNQGADTLIKQHEAAWENIWKETDVVIEGDPEAQQGIRYNIFQLYQTYRGDDSRLNIAPKGFTGEKYGGNTYWNTELCCVPFFLLSTPRPIVINLLKYRYNQLPRAIENARKLGFDGGAALFPQVTNNGEECHNEWEITFEEIHRNNIMVYAIMQHYLINGSAEYIARYGLEVMIAVSRFWSQRVSFSQPKQKYVILGVTGPNEYENNVDNNWYTNRIAAWSIGLFVTQARRRFGRAQAA